MLFTPRTCPSPRMGLTATVASDALALCGGHLKGLTSSFRDSAGHAHGGLIIPRGAGGWTTLLLFAPGVVAYHRGDEERARWWALQTAIAFVADYVFMPCKSIFHGIDRCCASYSLISSALRSWRGSPHRRPKARARTVQTRAVCLAAGVPALLCKSQSFKAVRRGDAVAFDRYHAMWHVFAAPAAMLVEARA